MSIIAAVEAFRVTGGLETSQKCLKMLYTNYDAARRANAQVWFIRKMYYLVT